MFHSVSFAEKAKRKCQGKAVRKKERWGETWICP